MLFFYQFLLYILLNIALFFLIDCLVTDRGLKEKTRRFRRAHKVDVWV